MRICFIFFLILSMRTAAQQKMELPLWPNGAPNSNGLQGAETGGETGRVANVSNPTISVYLPKESNGGALIACPGGGYSFVTMGKEGYSMAPWLNEQGIAVIVLKYRLPNGNWEVPLSDVEQAVRLVKKHAKEWKIDEAKLGILGSSAGGHLAATLSTQFSADTRPAFQVLLYPVITMEKNLTHAGSRKQLIGENPDAQLEQRFSAEKNVKAGTPPAFIVLSDDDKTVPSLNSILYYTALKQQKIPAEMHIYPSGGHGWGFQDSFKYKQHWTEALKKWLALQLSKDVAVK